MSYLPVATPRRRYTGLGNLGDLLSLGGDIYMQSVAQKHAAKNLKKQAQTEAILVNEQAKIQQGADAAAAQRTAQVVSVAKTLGIGAGVLGLLWILFGGGRKKTAAPVILVRRAVLPPPPKKLTAALPLAVPVKNSRRRRYARSLG